MTKTLLSVTLETIYNKALTGFVSVYKVTRIEDIVIFQTKEKGLLSPFDNSLLELLYLVFSYEESTVLHEGASGLTFNVTVADDLFYFTINFDINDVALTSRDDFERFTS